MTSIEQNPDTSEPALPKEEELSQEILRLNTDEIVNRVRLLENEIKV
jgi:hypothetical protein